MTVKISVITPCRNAARHIGDTVRSVLSQYAVQAGRVRLEYIICDGASTDGTIDIIRQFESPLVKVISEPDKTMYEALAKGLARATGDVVAYLNAGDHYHPGAFDAIAEVFQSKTVSWITGYGAFLNEVGSIVEVKLPYRYRKRLFESGMYGNWLPYVMQETTFWRRQLMDNLDFAALSEMRYAGDYFLWKAFSKRNRLCVIQALLGGFRTHAGQLSENTAAYRDEVSKICRTPNMVDFAVMAWDALFWFAPVGVKKSLNRDGILRYDNRTRQWV